MQMTLTLTFIANPRLEAVSLFVALARAVKKPSLNIRRVGLPVKGNSSVSDLYEI